MGSRWQHARENHLRDQVRLLLDTARALSREPSLESLFDRLYDLISERLDTTTFFIVFDSPEQDALQVAYYINEDERNYHPPRLLFGQSISCDVFTSGEPLMLNTADDFARRRRTVIDKGTEFARSAIFAPLRIGTRTIGVISAQSYEEFAYDRNALDLLVAIAEQTAIAIENVRYLRQIEEQRLELQLIVDVARGLASDEFSLEQMCRRIRDQLRTVMDANVFYLVLASEDRTTLRTEYCVEGDSEYVLDDYPLERTLAGTVIQSHEELVFLDAAEELKHRRFDFIGDTSVFAGSLMMVPLGVGERSIGVISVQSPHRHAFTDSSVRIVRSIADQLALAIRNVQLYRATEKRADHDSLTGVYNRRYALRRLAEELERAERHNSNVGVLMLDLDGLKQINDTFGHPAGDLAIRGVSEALQRACRKSDTIARFGGDEFLVIMPEVRSEQTGAMTERVRNELKHTNVEVRDGVFSPLQASMGIAVSTAGVAPNDLIASADAALYSDKVARSRRAG